MATKTQHKKKALPGMQAKKRDENVGKGGRGPVAIGIKNAGEMVIPPTPNLTDYDRKTESEAWFGTVSTIIPDKKIGFLTVDKQLPKDYKGNSLFFHLSVVKNTLGKTVKLNQGSKVKFVLYKAKDGEKEALDKPKAFAVYTTNLPMNKQEKTQLPSLLQIKTQDPESIQMRRFFVGGLSYQTSTEKLKGYFQAYGEVVDSVVMKNTDTGMSKGFGFVTFKTAFMARKCYSAIPHNMDGRSIEIKWAMPKTDAGNTKPKKENGETFQGIRKKLTGGSISKKVSIFWDIENCRPKNNKILEVVARIRQLVLEGHQEQSFMVVCDVTSESKEMIKQLEDAHVNVVHRSRTKKDSADEVLRQQMRKIVDTNSDPGRIVLISGDSDFSTDLNSFRFTKLWEIILIHNSTAKEALLMTANHAFTFDIVLGKEDTKSKKEPQGKKDKDAILGKEIKKSERIQRGEKLKGGKDKGNKNKQNTPNHSTKKGKDTLLKLRGKEDLTLLERNVIVESLIKKLKPDNPEAIEDAFVFIIQALHPSTIGDFLENLFISLIETDSQIGNAGGQLLYMLVSKDLINQNDLIQFGLNKILETSTDMDLSVIPDFWGSLAQILIPLFQNGALPLILLKDTSNILTSERMKGDYISSILNDLAKSSKMKAHKSWKDSGLKWTDFVANPVDVEAFLETHNLRWLGMGGLEVDSSITEDLLSFMSEEDSSNDEDESSNDEEESSEDEEEKVEIQENLIEF